MCSRKSSCSSVRRWRGKGGLLRVASCQGRPDGKPAASPHVYRCTEGRAHIHWHPKFPLLWAHREGATGQWSSVTDRTEDIGNCCPALPPPCPPLPSPLPPPRPCLSAAHLRASVGLRGLGPIHHGWVMTAAARPCLAVQSQILQIV